MHELVQDYYGKHVQRTQDLKTQACCNVGQIPQWLKPLVAHIHPNVMERSYGCGLICPPLLDGCRVLDLGCGAGRDVYLLAQLVGPQGEVIGDFQHHYGIFRGCGKDLPFTDQSTEENHYACC